jgi:hypothetical protein
VVFDSFCEFKVLVLNGIPFIDVAAIELVTYSFYGTKLFFPKLLFSS